MIDPLFTEMALIKKGIILPPAPTAVANYIPCKQAGNLLYISGQLPFKDGVILHPGIVGDNVSFDQAFEAAQTCALNILTILYGHVKNDWSKVHGCVRLGGFVAAVPAYTDHPKIINGASDFIAEILGEAGKHARAAVGVASLPLGACVEVDAIFEVASLEG